MGSFDSLDAYDRIVQFSRIEREMSVYFRNFYSSTPCQKYATAGIISALATFVVGFGTTSWTGVILFHDDLYDHIFEMLGLWQRCRCLYTEYDSSCICKRRTGDPGNLCFCLYVLHKPYLYICYIYLKFMSGSDSDEEILTKVTKIYSSVNTCTPQVTIKSDKLLDSQDHIITRSFLFCDG